MKKQTKNIIAGVIAGIFVLLTGSALSGWNETLVKKIDLSENYLNKNEIDENFCKKSEFQLLKQRVEHVANTQIRFETKLDALILHFGVKVAQGKEECPYPPCRQPKKKTTEVVVEDGY